VFQNFIIATEQAVSGRPAHLWIYDRKSDDFSGYKLALDRQPNDVVMYDARRQLSLDCESLLTYVTIGVGIISFSPAKAAILFYFFSICII